MGQPALSTPLTTFTGSTSSAPPYNTTTSSQPTLNDSQLNTSGYGNGSYMGGFPASPDLTQQQQQQQQQQQRAAQSFSMSPTAFLNTQGKGDKLSSGANYAMKSESSLEGVTFPGQQDLFSSFPQPQMPPPPPQGYGAMNRTSMTSPDPNYSMPLKDEASMGSVGQFLNQFLSDPLNPSQVPSQSMSDSSQCFQQPGNDPPTQPSLPSSAMFQFPTSPLQQGQQFESSTVGPVPTLPQQPSTTSPNESQILRVSSAGNLGMLTGETPVPVRPPLSRGKSEPIRHLEQQVKHLAEENERQMMEIEKQQSIAQQHYVAILQQIAEQQASGRASQQQQEILRTVLSDPSLISILRDVLLSHPPPSILQDGGDGGQRSARLQPLSITPTKMNTDCGAQLSSTPSPLLSPSQPSQVKKKMIGHVM